MDKLLSLTNYKTLVWSDQLNTTLESMQKFYDFETLGIQNRYFVLKNLKIDFFTEGGVSKILCWEAAYDNTAKTVNANTRYSLTNNANILLSEKLLILQKITVQLFVNGITILNNDSYSPINFDLDFDAFIPTKIQTDFDLKMKSSGFKDILGTTFDPFIYARMTGFSLDDKQLENLQAGEKIQDVNIVNKKFLEPKPGEKIPSLSITKDRFIKEF